MLSLVLLTAVALAEPAPAEVSLAAGETGSLVTAAENPDQRFTALAVRAGLTPCLGIEGRGAGFLGPTEQAASATPLLFATRGDTSADLLVMSLLRWSGSLAMTWTPAHGLISVADEAAVPVELRLIGGLEAHGGTNEAVTYQFGGDGLEMSRRRMGGSWTGLGGVAAVAARAWIAPRIALDFEMRETVLRRPAAHIQPPNATVVPGSRWQEQTSFAVALTVSGRPRAGVRDGS